MTRERSYQDLIAWQKAIVLVEDVYRETRSWPADERFGLTMQVRRAVVSVPANIAEGSGRNGVIELRRFLSIAHGSLCEVQTHLEIASRLGFMAPVTTNQMLGQCSEISRIINGLIRSLNRPRTAKSRSGKPLSTFDSRLSTTRNSS